MIVISPVLLSRSSSVMSLLSSRSKPRTPPITLTEVILDALSDHAYRFALDNPELLEQCLSMPDTLLHLGSIHEIPSDQLQNGHLSHPILRYRTLMLEPTSRGHVDPYSTKVIVVHSRNPDSLVAASLLSEPADSDSIEIDESFLENAVAPKALRFNGPVGNADNLMNGRHTPQVLFNVEPLLSPASPLEDHCTLYIRTSDLGRVGILNEDWVSIPPSLFDQTSHRRFLGSRQYKPRVQL
jgi:peroxin-6